MCIFCNQNIFAAKEFSVTLKIILKYMSKLNLGGLKVHNFEYLQKFVTSTLTSFDNLSVKRYELAMIV